jgi:hypothetical protein
MQRDLSSLPLPPAVRAKLSVAGFVTVDDIADLKPSEIDKGSNLLKPHFMMDIPKMRVGLKTYTFRFFDILHFTNTDVGVRFSYTCLDIAFGCRHNTSDRRKEVRNLRGSV